MILRLSRALAPPDNSLLVGTSKRVRSEGADTHNLVDFPFQHFKRTEAGGSVRIGLSDFLGR